MEDFWADRATLERGWDVLLLAALAGYLLGSIPGGAIMARLRGLGDLSKVGSGNTGATNVLRTGDKWAALATLLIDGGKAAAAVLLTLPWGMTAAMVAGLASFFGHIWSPWLRFRGGKGVATFFGLTLALFWPVGLLSLATWLATAFFTRISSVAALTAAALGPVWYALFERWGQVGLALALAALIWLAHSANIRRLLAGAEPRISLGSRK
jgi:glycerol-3-phosphate acyltransferase PlsY